MKTIIILLSLLLSIYVDGRTPKYIDRCRLSDEYLNACIAKNANKAISSIIKGDPALGLPPLNPLEWDTIEIRKDDNLQFSLWNVQIHGIPNFKVETTLYNHAEVKSGIILSNPSLSFVGDYQIDGTILKKPIFGKGIANITLVNSVLKWVPKIELVEKNGKQYFHIPNENLKIASTSNIYHFEDLFNGDSIKGVQMNKFLNKNWGEVSELFEESISSFIGKLITRIDNYFINTLSVTDIFDP